MATFTIVAGNQNKLKEFHRLLPKALNFDSRDIDLEEIQSNDLELIIKDKARRAYEVLHAPVLVEDVSAGLVSLGGLPGPFIKFFEERLGEDALYRLAGDDTRAVATCTIAYFDGARYTISKGEVHGTVVSRNVSNGFGFDCVFIPDGNTKTFAEMTDTEKDATSHRAIAVKKLLEQLDEL